jgi:hypothetical protein
MKQKTAIILSIAVTAFLLVITGAVAALATDAPTQTAATSEATLPAEVADQIQQREADYLAALEDANAKLEQAYQTIEAMQTEQKPTEAVETTMYPVSPDLAVGLALNLVPGAKLQKWPELVNFQGTVAYEIILDKGAVYISATDAILLHNGAQANVSSSQGEDDHHDDDHEEGEHEDDD